VQDPAGRAVPAPATYRNCQKYRNGQLPDCLSFRRAQS
jgi:hypothetical protein